MSQWQKHGSARQDSPGAVVAWMGDSGPQRGPSENHGVRRYDRWTPEEVGLLGQISDADLARILGRSIYSIRLQRRKFGIIGPDRPIRRWTADEEELLGRFQDQDVAGMIDRSALAVGIRRRELGIPTLWPGGTRAWTDEEINILLTFPAKVAVRKTGRSVGAVKSKRFKMSNFARPENGSFAARLQA